MKQREEYNDDVPAEERCPRTDTTDRTKRTNEDEKWRDFMDKDDLYDLRYVESTYGYTICLDLIPAQDDNEDPSRRGGNGPVARLCNEYSPEDIYFTPSEARAVAERLLAWADSESED